jgi:hypothetical protein
MLAATLPPNRAVLAAEPATTALAVTAIRVPAAATRNGAANMPKPGRPRRVITTLTLLVSILYPDPLQLMERLFAKMSHSLRRSRHTSIQAGMDEAPR